MNEFKKKLKMRVILGALLCSGWSAFPSSVFRFSVWLLMLPCGILGSKFLTCSSKAFPDGHLLPVLPFRCQILALRLKLRDQVLYQIADIPADAV